MFQNQSDKVFEKHEEDIKPMNFHELFSSVNDDCREIVLHDLVEELMEKYQEDFDWSEIFEVFAEYIKWEAERDGEIEPAYEAVTKLLLSAAQATKEPPHELDAAWGAREQTSTRQECGDRLGMFKRVDREAKVTARIANHARRRLLLRTVRCWFRGLQAEKYRTSQLLLALSAYVEAKKKGESGDFESWAIVAQILKDAAAAAEQKGEELP